MGVPVARIFGIEIRVQVGWVLVLALIGVIAVGQLGAVQPGIEETLAWVLGVVIALGFFASSVAHDLAHALVARRRGIDVTSIAVSFFGGATPLDPTSTDPRDDFAIAASGPIVSLAIGLLLLLLTGASMAAGESFTTVASVLTVLVFLNLVLGLVNLVPSYPLDGGRIVRALAWRRTGSERSGWRVAATTGRLTGMLVIGLGILFLAVDSTPSGAMVALTGWFLILSSNAVRDRVKIDDLVGHLRVADAMESDPPTVMPTLTVDTFASQLLDGGSNVTAVPVVHDDRVIGLLGIAQVRRLKPSAWATTRVADAMAIPPQLVTTTPESTLKSAMEALAKSRLDGLPVMVDDRLVGVVTRRSISRKVLGAKGRAA